MRTAYGTVEEAVEAMTQGADDFIIKTVDFQLIESVVHRPLEHALAVRWSTTTDEEYFMFPSWFDHVTALQ